MGPADIIFLLSLLVSPGTAADDACDAPAPLVLPIGNTTISDTGVKRWGVRAQFGTPGQSLTPVLHADLNSTSLWPPEIDCPELDRPACAWMRGGSFDPSKSDSWTESTESDVYEFLGPDVMQAMSPWGKDTLSLGSKTTLEQFPIFTPSRGDILESMLGLGRRSTLLEMLVKQKRIASRTWSLFWGWQGLGESQQVEGNLVLGGYDTAKVADKPNSTQGFSDDERCPTSLLVNIKDITVNHAGGGTRSLLKAPGSAMQSCIKPDSRLMTFPEHVYKNFRSAMPGDYLGTSEGMYHSGLSYDSEGSFAGNLTITLFSDLSITIPNHQLVLPKVGVRENADSYGLDYIGDSKIVMIYDGSRGMPVLGHPFLSAAYLHVDNEQEKFTLWEAEPTDDVQPVAVSHTPNGERSTCNSDSVSNPETSGAPDTADNNNNDDGRGAAGGSDLSAGPIAGIVIGVVAAIAIICLAGFFLMRRHWQVKAMRERAHAAALQNGAASEKIHICDPEELDAGQHHEALPEMRVREGSALELPGDSPLPGDETPVTVDHDDAGGGDREVADALSSSSRYHSPTPRSLSSAGFQES